MNKNRRYPISEELFEGIIPIIKRLEGLEFVLRTLGDNIGWDKHNLWKKIHAEYPELQGEQLRIDEGKREIVLVTISEGSSFETLQVN